jgi:hypothetical protein
MTENEHIKEIISEMMSCLDTAVDRIQDAADLLDLSRNERERLKKHGIALERAIKDLKKYFLSSSCLDREVQKQLEAHLR